MNHNRYGLFYVDKEGQKYFYRSYASLELLYYAIENDKEFIEKDKKEVIVIRLDEEF